MSDKGDQKLFADDAKLYSTDPFLLQSSVDRLVSWLNLYQLKLAPEKCYVVDIVKKKHYKTPDRSKYINQCRGKWLESTGHRGHCALTV